MLVVTTNKIPGQEYEVIGLVMGSVVRAKHIGRDIAAGLKSLAGGEIKGYTELLNEARTIASERMVAAAKAQGADAVVCVRFDACSVMTNASEIMAYGTAVKFV